MHLRLLPLTATVAAALLLGACSDGSSSTTATTTTTATAATADAPTTSADGSTASTAGGSTTDGSTADAPAATTVDANTASVDEIAAALDAAGVPNADRWALEVEEYRPYSGTDDWAKLKQELSKYNIDQETLTKLLSALTVS